MKTKRTFTNEFKAEAVALLNGGSQSMSAVAKQLGLAPPVLRAWRNAARTTPCRPGGPGQQGRVSCPAGLGSPADMASEISSLRAANARLAMHNEILKKAIGVFSGEPK